MGLDIINITVNYEDDEGQEQTEQERYDEREGKTPLWARAIIKAVEAVAYVFNCKPEYVIIELFDTRLQEQQYRELVLSGVDDE